MSEEQGAKPQRGVLLVPGVERHLDGPSIQKSTRHGEILGRFGEYAVCNWLSRSGFEVCLVNHTGIDVIGYHPEAGRLGITVKSRTRKSGKESEAVNILSKDDREKIKRACDAFDCVAW